ncbi:MAG: aminotransferase class I/II-fold pyridoxal phosphate-dependent enzyme [Promicromonosporaceae bacterium]|nr:aminotransferase class I/II-fold pyridoxal phosphate-dependent enzyme [Promicromonosporaceae bacterium]
MTTQANWAFETRQIHAGQTPDSQTGARALPIYQSTSFVFPSAEVAADRFALKDLGPIYTRIGNPTTEVVENRIADLEGGVGALLVASGAAAIHLALLNVAEAGDHVVSSSSLYGGTYNLLHNTFPKLGIETTFVTSPHDPQQWRDAIKPNTKALFAESVPNPKCDVLDIETVADIAHDAGVPLIVDNTVPSPYLLRPIEFGADVVVHSTTKFLGGHGSSIGGAIVDGGTFDYALHPEKFPGFNQPDPSYNGLVFARDLGVGGLFGANVAYGLKARVQLLRDLGPAVSPLNAFLLAQGIETLSLRMERHIENTLKVARWLDERPEVAVVHCADLPSSPWHANARKYLPKGAGSVIGFEFAAADDEVARAAGQNFVSALKLHSNVANIGDVRSLVIHPASTTHSQLSTAEQRAAGVSPGLVRLSVGLEHIDDILADLELGLTAACG